MDGPADKIAQANMGREVALMTPEQRFKASRQEDMYVSKHLMKSPAWWSLRTAAACQVYGVFLTKRQMQPIKVAGKSGKRRKTYTVANNGEIKFSYTEAERDYGIKPGTFRRAIDELLRVGLIDIAHSGYGLYRDMTLYAISERWKLYGTPDFVERKRPTRGRELGFRKGNRRGRNCTKTKSNVADNS